MYHATVKKVMDFGAFVEFLPGKEGLVHVSQLDVKSVEKPSDVVKVGDQFDVKIIDQDDQGRYKLSRKVLMAGGATASGEAAEHPKGPIGRRTGGTGNSMATPPLAGLRHHDPSPGSRRRVCLSFPSALRHAMIVMKFGGTSNRDAAAMGNVCRIIASHIPGRPIVVISAISSATNNLEASAREAAAGDARAAWRSFAGFTPATWRSWTRSSGTRAARGS